MWHPPRSCVWGRFPSTAARSCRAIWTGFISLGQNLSASWEKPDDDNSNIEWVRVAWREIKRYSTGGTYVNLLTEEEAGELGTEVKEAMWKRARLSSAA